VLLISSNRKIETQSPVIMGIINLTPDSFFADSRFPSVNESVDRAGKMIDEGARILDLGAVSTRPGAGEVNPETEYERLWPALAAIRKAFPDIFISVDTYRSMIAKESVNMGADMINDISGGTFDDLMLETIATLNIPYVLMHTGGKPETMQENPVYENVLEEVKSFFTRSLNRMNNMNAHQIVLDPGFGFGKTIAHNYRLLAGLSEIRKPGHPVMIGVSRKSMINKVLHLPAAGALNGTSVINTIGLLNGADIVRVHDVNEAVQCRELLLAYREYGLKND
jgi:dihydropteroate synthase